ncbi:MAG: DUF547 domain-containing protein [bacterium]
MRRHGFLPRPRRRLALRCAATALLLATLLPTSASAAPDPAQELPAVWTRFLRDFTRNGDVDYAAVAASPDRVAELDRLFRNSPARLEPGFWIDAYNFLAIRTVAEHWPIRSPKEIAGFFHGVYAWIADRRVTLDRIELEELDAHADPRIHLALVCAARSCPPLRDRAYYLADLDVALTQASIAALASPDIARPTASGGLELSPLFEWYRDDFETLAGGVRGFLARYGDGLPGGKISSLEYDWSVNVAAPAGDTGLPAARDLAFDSPAALLLPGEWEIKTFHNVYTQTAYFDDDAKRVDVGARQTWYTGDVALRWGYRPRVNFQGGLVLRGLDDGTRALADESSRFALSTIFLRAQVAPLTSSDLVIETGVEVPLDGSLTVEDSTIPLDVGAVTVRAQMDRFHRPDVYGYYELGIRAERREDGGDVLSFPAKAILHWVPQREVTLTLPLEIAPQRLDDGGFGMYTQVGVGAKFRPSPRLELETIGTVFPFGYSAGAGWTANVGLRRVF